MVSAADAVGARALLGAFAAATAVDLGSLLADWHLGHVLAKPLLMPLLVAYVITRRAPRLLIAALLFGWGGDLALLFDAEPAFLVGMGSFAAGHVCYLVLFGRRATNPLLGAAYAVALLATIGLLWGDLPADLRIPVAGYSLLLTAMAYRSSALGARAGIGGALFLLSDTLIASGVAEWPQLPRPDLWIMATYLAAQYLLATGTPARRTGVR
ncbi:MULTISPECIES: lysoplasmalogenase [unclassified Streptomyces]|uniref:lysoplasmalogenase n=1 Tax=unclassified Streptomyces TaxID=2593676 RepID=UPI00225237EC|nr:MULTISPECIES: lysoplasmalogenase [unclassified Streptomyces]MCX4525155.1 lysoplasmalogenase [Streptomyces sp. NBC_01551]MCX4544333.1 lysoplasmalogenase [Streptomyces sp. NBC_01565]